MAEYSRLARGKVSLTGTNTAVILPFVPDYVEFINFSAVASPFLGNVPFAFWDVGMGQGVAAYEVFNAALALTTATTASGGITTFAAGLSLQYGPTQQVVSSTKGYPTTFTVTNHGYSNGDTVVFEGLYQTPTTGMPQMCGPQFLVSAVTTNTFQVTWKSFGTDYTALSGSPVGAVVKKVLYPFLYVPGDTIIASIDSVGTQTGVATTAAHNLVVGQEIAFRVPANWGMLQINSLPNNIIPGSPIYAYVTQVVSTNSFFCNINSSSFTPFIDNQPVSSVPGLNFPQVVAVGDINSGGWPYTGGALYPSPVVNGVSTINGPAIQGAFINNTNQGFIIGPTIGFGAGNTVYWRAFLHDYSSP